MAGLKDIKRRIKSVKNTKKITYAMKLVSTAKLKKAQDAVKSSAEYTEILHYLLNSLLSKIDISQFEHPLMEVREEVKNARLIVVGASRGLCGVYNTNLHKCLLQEVKELKSKYSGVNIAVVGYGKKIREFCERNSITVAKSYEDLGEDPNTWPLEETLLDVKNNFITKKIDLVKIIYTRFKSAMSMKPISISLLPFAFQDQVNISQNREEEVSEEGDILFEPSAERVFLALVPRLMNTLLLQACLDAKASEHGARMVAMDAATTNAGELINKLTLTHNKLRQSGITAELLDIIGGAEALK